ncbi:MULTISPECIES: GlsB/YeaQ/YmgE family stress response membrane protein [unclassified Ensifer]|uniref:GlsB/YeaQ/YmgE family stress response membrane protein n=1 Tax=unclassified Ensifer TaxID=2633371 RepID=UPI000DD62A5D|nr:MULTISPECIES: GlsB/YeaQ/YmgE family stress response membrane protein [unclassified Ensifer]MBD9495915.1 GlsB/YeaQ/YmgE family stress response membrane protein [Ensifer sp. ENS01]MBD9522220.1 GlsB/YeaQ/YmgE family stress response membrane protein [Ensifer sp. ENS02]
MSVNGVGILAAIIVGGLAGWLAEKFMGSSMGPIMNIVLGIIGAVVLNFVLAAFGMAYAGWVAYLIIGFIGACLLIAAGRVVKR